MHLPFTHLLAARYTPPHCRLPSYPLTTTFYMRSPPSTNLQPHSFPTTHLPIHPSHATHLLATHPSYCTLASYTHLSPQSSNCTPILPNFRQLQISNTTHQVATHSFYLIPIAIYVSILPQTSSYTLLKLCIFF
jgi:hypothetical protein